MKLRGVVVNVMIVFMLIISLGYSARGEDFWMDDPEFNATTGSKPFPDGLWGGIITKSNGDKISIYGVSYQGEMMWAGVRAGKMYSGYYVVNGGRYLNGAVSEFNINGAQIDGWNIRGNVINSEEVIAHYTSPSGAKGTIALMFDRNYNHSSSLSLITGTWIDTIRQPYNTIITIKNDGSFVVKDALGNVLQSGNIEILEPAHNVYGVTANPLSSDDATGSYSGLGFIAYFDNSFSMLLINKDGTQCLLYILERL